MKTVVLGLFDRLEDAERVLAQLASAPLDLDAVQILHRDTAVQRRLSERAGIAPRRAMRTGLVSGGLLGAALGFAAGWSGLGEPLLAGPGPLLTLAGGALLGALAGLLGGALSESSQIPEIHAHAALTAVSDGATMVSIQTANQPTARAIGDLFRAGGSRVLGEDEPADLPEGGDAAFRPPDREDPALESERGKAADDATTLPEAHAPFAPPWRRNPDEPQPSTSDPIAGTLFPDAPNPVPTAAETEASKEASPDLERGDAGRGVPPAQRGIRHGETVTTIDQTSRDVLPRDLPETPKAARPAPTEPPRPEPIETTAASPASSVGSERPATAAREAIPADVERSDAAARESDPTSLDGLGLSARVTRALHKAGVTDLPGLQAAARSTSGLAALPGIGPTALREIDAGMSRLGIDPSGAAASRQARVRNRSTDLRIPEPPANSDPRLAPVTRAADEVLREIFGKPEA